MVSDCQKFVFSFLYQIVSFKVVNRQIWMKLGNFVQCKRLVTVNDLLYSIIFSLSNDLLLVGNTRQIFDLTL